MAAGRTKPKITYAEDVAVAVAAAEAAAGALLELRSGLAAEPDKGREIGKLGDERSHALLVSLLTRAYPHDAILSEESADDPARLASERVWIIDPLDGTREFGEPFRTDWAVHVALVQGGELTVGVVALPARGRTFSSADPPPLPPRHGPIRLAVSRTRPPAVAEAVGSRIGATLMPMGSAGAKTMAILLGEADIYLHAGGQHEWDSAAPVAVALAAGLHASRIDGSPLRYNRFPAWQPDLLICRPELSAAVLEAIKGVPDHSR
jgi:3'(2'), 5'-bisphosphate nucleotidase